MIKPLFVLGETTTLCSSIVATSLMKHHLVRLWSLNGQKVCLRGTTQSKLCLPLFCVLFQLNSIYISVNDIPGDVRVAVEEKHIDNEIPKRKNDDILRENLTSDPPPKRWCFSFTALLASFQNQSNAMSSGGATSLSLPLSSGVSTTCVFVPVPKSLVQEVMMFISSHISLSSPSVVSSYSSCSSSSSSSTTNSPSCSKDNEDDKCEILDDNSPSSPQLSHDGEHDITE